MKRQESVTVNGTRYRGGYTPVNGPQLIEDQRIRSGYPTSVDDVRFGLDLIPPGCHAVGTLVLTAEAIHAAQHATEHSGRKPAASLETMRAVKAAYWSGFKTMRELSEEHRLDLKTVFRIVHGVTAWYV